MTKKMKIIISTVLCLVIICTGVGVVLLNRGTGGEKQSREFIKAIGYLQDEEYVKAYNEVKDSDQSELEIIQTLILSRLGEEFDKNTEIAEKIYDEAENISDYLSYPSLYSRDDSYQQNIDKIYDKEFSKLYDIKEKIPVDIIFDDAKDFYNAYFEYLDLANGLFRNYESNIIDDRLGLLDRVTEVQNKLTEVSDEYTKILEKHPTDIVPEEYTILLDLVDTN